jgi:DNA polymerase-3 subunit delta'
MLFSEVIGQNEVKAKLRASVKTDRIPHAQMFFGPEGSGALPMAIAYAQYVSCTNRGEIEACGTCPSCRKYSKLVHPDLHFAFPVNTSEKVTKDPVSDDYINEWRNFVLSTPYFHSNQWYNYIGIENKQGLISKNDSEAIIRKLSFKSYESDYKIMIIWLPEKMNVTAANMLLKLIEEPPAKTLFLLVSEEPEKVLVTLSSRTQTIKLSRIDDKSLKEALIKKFELDTEQLENIIRLANGNYIQAVEIIESSADNELYFESFTGIMRFCYTPDYLKINDWVEEMAGIGREKLKKFFDYALRLVRENFVLNLSNPGLVYLSSREADFSKRFHPFINGHNVVKICDEMNRASNDIERNAYAKAVLFDFALCLVKIIR